MHQFHQICSKDINLSQNRTVAEINKESDHDTLFSADPLSPGEPFSVKVNKTWWSPHLTLGITGQSPQQWEERGAGNPRKMMETWCLGTMFGHTWINYFCTKLCDSWREMFGYPRLLSAGDILSVTLCEDRSVSITYHNTEVTRVFTDLPDIPLWLVIVMNVVKLEVLQPGMRTLKSWCCRTIINCLDGTQQINQLPLPAKLHEDLKEYA